MIFSSATFLFLFLPIVLALYMLCSGIRARNIVLLIASLFFYTWGEAQYVLVLLVSILCTRSFGTRIAGSDGARRKLWLFLALTINLILLVYFKYANFLLDNVNEVLAWLEVAPIEYKDVRLPLGISFFTFQAISYLIDVYRGQSRAQPGFVGVALYISLFPQLVAGPIVRYASVEKQISHRTVTASDFADGARRFITGLAKKLLVANTLGAMADDIFAASPDQLLVSTAWIGVCCYALQIYFDFSGYSDMAIGLGRMLGFRFGENFNYPYTSRSIQEFWRRWHISLSSWFRDYVYIPLGGSRRGNWRTGFNLLLVFVLCGIWHGASWTFVIWGLFHGFFLILERLVPGIARLPRVASHIYVIAVVLVSWVFFRSDDLPTALDFLRTMAGFNSADAAMSLAFFADPKVYITLAFAVVLSTPVARRVVYAGHPSQSIQQWAGYRLILSDGVLLVLFGLCIVTIAGGTYDPFIYFRF